MNKIRSLMGRRQFLVAAGVASTSALTLKRLTGVIDPVFNNSAAMASERSATANVKGTSKRYGNLLSPIKIGNVVLKNRMYSTEAVPHFLQGPENFPAESSRAYAANLAKNGAAIVSCRIIQNRVREELIRDSAHMIIYDLEDAGVQNYLDQLVEGIHCYGSKASAPINISLPGETPMGTMPATGLPGEPGEGMPGEPGAGMPGGEGRGAGAGPMASLSSAAAEISAEDSEKMIENAVTQAKFFQTHGFDVVTMRCPNVKDRIGFGAKLYQAIKKACGQDFLIESPITVIDPTASKTSETASALTVEEAVELAKKWEGLADILQLRVAGGATNHPDGFNQEKNKPLSLRFAQAIKKSGAKVVTAPNGGFNDLDFNEECIATGKTDMIAMGRPFIADWEYGKKAYEGRGEDRVPCIMCNKCHGFDSGPWMTVCSVNPKLGIDPTVRIIDLPTAKKKVAVIGGGPAGMKAAIVAAERGHKVTLYEKEDALGGQARHADYSPYKWPLKDFKDYLIRQLEKTGVDVLLGKSATPDMINAKGYDAVLVAVGAEPIIPKIPGADGKNIYNLINVYANERSLGKNVTVVGGGQFGAETAVYLAKCGHEVTILSSERQLVQPSGPHQLGSITDAGRQMENFTSITEVTTIGISSGKVTYIDAKGNEKSVQADDVVIYAGFRPMQEEAMKFSGTANQMIILGECSGIGSGIQKSQRSAFFAASQI